MRPLILLLFLLNTGLIIAQPYNPLYPPNSFQSKENPNYWKNRPPFPGYWQQDVHYTIKATIDETQDLIDGEEHLVYTNNSPDDLEYVYFHLYQEAFQPGSYADKLSKANKVVPEYGPYESLGMGTKVESIVADGHELKTEKDNTILKVYLERPLKSGTSITFHIRFKTYFDNNGNVGRRMKQFTTAGHKHYDGVHWYPRISVYDRKFGWTTDQHLGKEFYGDFGCFDVELNFSSNYIVEATGNLINREEVLPQELRKKLDIKNFTQPKSEASISEIIPYDAKQRKTWKYHAENVHDFAFTADPTYRIGEAEWNGIKTIALAQEHHAWKWQNAAEYTARIIEVYSRDFGMYVYHKMVVADAEDGMEYPMLTLDGGFDPDYRTLLAHEVGHNWFFGQVGNNETYRAALDEGFTQFLTAWAVENIDGDTLVRTEPRDKYTRNFKKKETVRENQVYYGYLRDAIRGDDAYLNTHSDDFESALGHGGGYGQVYYKTATMLYNLQYVLGDRLFQDAMKHYFEQWKICHPYVEDFRNSIIQFTKADLNWFFDQWLETKKTIDYAVVSAKYGNQKDQFVIRFKRKGEMQMPIDFSVTSASDSVFHFHIPNTWFEKETNATILPRWIGWGKLESEHEVTVVIPGGIKDVQIDPSRRLADVNKLNNSLKLPVTYSFDSKIYNTPDLYSYEVNLRPEVWYNGYDGFKPGFHMNGSYMKYKHVFELTTWLSTGFLQRVNGIMPNYDGVNTDFDMLHVNFSYRTPTEKLMKRSSFFMDAKSLEGMQGGRIGMEKYSENEKIRFYSFFKLMYRKDTADLYYLIYPDEWIADKFNNTLNIGVDKNYTYKGGWGKVNFNLKSSSLGSDYDFAQLSMTSIHSNRIGKTTLKTRLFAQYGTGTNLARESALFLAGANPEEMMDSKFYRSVGFFDYDWHQLGSDVSSLQMGGGLNLRGYSGYLVPEEDENGTITYHYSGNTGASVSAEWDLQGLIPWRPYRLSRYFGVNLYLFGDAGVISKDNTGKSIDPAFLRADAGVGTALSIKRFGPLQMVKPLTIRFDMPLFLNAIPAGQKDYFMFRYLIGINRSF